MSEEPEAEAPAGRSTKRGIAGWVERRAQRVVTKLYESRADEIEDRAKRVVSSAYERSADDLEDRAVRALRSALTLEAERIKEAIEHGVRVKKREVRLSLLVLVVAALVYLVLFWVTRTPPPT